MQRYPIPVTDPNLHVLRVQSAPTQRDSETLHLVARCDVQWGKPIFRAPALPTPRQLSSELPFTVNFRPRLRRAS